MRLPVLSTILTLLIWALGIQALHAVEPAPASSDNQTVILWVVGILVVVVGFLMKRLFDKTDASELLCRDENSKLRSEVQQLREVAHKEQQENNAKALSAVHRMAEAVTGLKDAIAEAGSGIHKATKVTDT